MAFDQPLSVNDAAAALGVSRARLYELLNAGEIVGFKLGHKTQIRSSEVEKFFASLPKYQPGRKATTAA